jgi:hypothetical protein
LLENLAEEKEAKATLMLEISQGFHGKGSTPDIGKSPKK